MINRVEKLKVCKEGRMLPFLPEKHRMKNTVPYNLKSWSVAGVNETAC